MGDRPKDLNPYLIEHVRDALAHDPRVGELDVVVEIDGETVVLSGTVATADRQEAAADAVRDLLPNHHVRDETEVADFVEPTEVEHLP
ncbi:MAG: BON domain-containing protein [Chloroflexi bacterium]|nr:BON domain-containing protein [Chloroflexota bacterium]